MVVWGEALLTRRSPLSPESGRGIKPGPLPCPARAGTVTSGASGAPFHIAESGRGIKGRSLGVPAAVQEQGEVPRIGARSFGPLGVRLPAAVVVVRTPSQGELITEHKLQPDHSIERKPWSQGALRPGYDTLADAGSRLQSALAHGDTPTRLGDRGPEVFKAADDTRIARYQIRHASSFPDLSSPRLVQSLRAAWVRPRTGAEDHASDAPTRLSGETPRARAEKA